MEHSAGCCNTLKRHWDLQQDATWYNSNTMHRMSCTTYKFAGPLTDFGQLLCDRALSIDPTKRSLFRRDRGLRPPLLLELVELGTIIGWNFQQVNPIWWAPIFDGFQMRFKIHLQKRILKASAHFEEKRRSKRVLLSSTWLSWTAFQLRPLLLMHLHLVYPNAIYLIMSLSL